MLFSACWIVDITLVSGSVDEPLRQGVLIIIPNREIDRFVTHVGGNTPASKILGCTPDMIRKLKTGLRGFNPGHVRAMYYTKGFKLSWLRLYDIDFKPKR